MPVGFTGTRQEITANQEGSLALLLMILAEHEHYLHHGGCVGADETAHTLARQLGYMIIIRLPIDKTRRAFCEGGTEYPAKTHLERNIDIVDSCSILIAVPRTRNEEQRSGTWATVRYARKMRKSIFIIDPDGRIRKDPKQCL